MQRSATTTTRLRTLPRFRARGRLAEARATVGDLLRGAKRSGASSPRSTSHDAGEALRPTLRLGFWSSVAILISGAGLVVGILASALFLPSALTTDWRGIEPYADAYRATGGVITSLPFLAALISCPAYVVQVASIQRLDTTASRIRRGFGVASSSAFALLAGLNYAVQLLVVRPAILAGRTENLAWLVFQNPDSLMLSLDLAGWFFLGLAFLSVAPFFRKGTMNRAIRYLLIANAVVGTLLPVLLILRNPALGQIILAVMTVMLTCADILLIAFFRQRLGRPPTQARGQVNE